MLEPVNVIEKEHVAGAQELVDHRVVKMLMWNNVTMVVELVEFAHNVDRELHRGSGRLHGNELETEVVVEECHEPREALGRVVRPPVLQHRVRVLARRA